MIKKRAAMAIIQSLLGSYLYASVFGVKALCDLEMRAILVEVCENGGSLTTFSIFSQHKLVNVAINYCYK